MLFAFRRSHSGGIAPATEPASVRGTRNRRHIPQVAMSDRTATIPATLLSRAAALTAPRHPAIRFAKEWVKGCELVLLQDEVL